MKNFSKERIEKIATEHSIGGILAAVLFELEEKRINYTFKKQGEEYCKLFAGWIYSYSIGANGKQISVENTVADYEDSYKFELDGQEDIWITNDDTKPEKEECIKKIIEWLAFE